MKKISLVYVILLLGACGLGRQYRLHNSPIKVTPSIVLYAEDTSSSQAPFPDIAINPESPENIILCSVPDNIHRSRNSGSIWTSKNLESGSGISGTPCIISNGLFHYFHLSDSIGTTSDSCAVKNIVYHSTQTNGLIWSPGKYVARSDNAQYEPYAITGDNGIIHLTWIEVSRNGSCRANVKYATSDDNGNTWSDAYTISSLPIYCNNCGKARLNPRLSVDRNGVLYLVYTYRGNIYFNKSSDDGKSWLGTDKQIVRISTGTESRLKSRNTEFTRAFLAVDKSRGPFAGRLYIVFTQKQRHGQRLFLTYSEDKGETWTDPAMILNTGEQLFPAMSLDPIDGQIYLVYYMPAVDTPEEYDVYLSNSTDGGEVFHSRIISRDPTSLPFYKKSRSQLTAIEVYHGIVRPVWTQYKKGKQELAMGLINRTTTQ